MQLDCLVNGPPNINYNTTWYKEPLSAPVGDGRLPDSPEVVKGPVGGYVSYLLEDVGLDDTGRYTCFIQPHMSAPVDAELELIIVCKCLNDN